MSTSFPFQSCTLNEAMKMIQAVAEARIACFGFDSENRQVTHFPSIAGGSVPLVMAKDPDGPGWSDLMTDEENEETDAVRVRRSMLTHFKEGRAKMICLQKIVLQPMCMMGSKDGRPAFGVIPGPFMKAEVMYWDPSRPADVVLSCFVVTFDFHLKTTVHVMDELARTLWADADHGWRIPGLRFVPAVPDGSAVETVSSFTEKDWTKQNCAPRGIDVAEGALTSAADKALLEIAQVRWAESMAERSGGDDVDWD